LDNCGLAILTSTVKKNLRKGGISY
jgi:hypothetical protein